MKPDVRTFAAAGELEGWFTNAEGWRLASLAAEVNNGDEIVEIGAFAGRSTAFLVSGALGGRGAHITTLDDWGPASVPGGTVQGPAEEVFEWFLENVNLAFVTPIRARSTQIESFWVKPIGLLFLDATHLYEDTFHDLDVWTPHIVGYGKVALHDYHEDHPGVVQAVDEFVGQGGWVIEEQVESLCILRRVA